MRERERERERLCQPRPQISGQIILFDIAAFSNTHKKIDSRFEFGLNSTNFRQTCEKLRLLAK